MLHIKYSTEPGVALYRLVLNREMIIIFVLPRSMYIVHFHSIFLYSQQVIFFSYSHLAQTWIISSTLTNMKIYSQGKPIISIPLIKINFES